MTKTLFKFFLLPLLLANLSHAQSLDKLEAALKRQPNNSKVREQLAEQYLNAAKFDKVIELLNPYTDVINLPAYLNLASAYSEKADFENQVRVLKLLAAKDEENYQAHFVLGHALLKQAEAQKDETKKRKIIEDSITSFRTSIHLKDNYKPAYDALLDLFIKNKNNYESRAIIADMIKHFGKRPEFYNDLCRLFSVDGFIEQAIENCKLGIKAAPDYPDNYVYLSASYIDQKEDEKATKTLLYAARNFTQSEFVQRSTGDYYAKQKNYPVSARYYKQALQINESSSAAQLGLAQSMLETGETRESLVHFQRACELDSSLYEELLSAAGKLRQKSDLVLATKFSSVAYACKARQTK